LLLATLPVAADIFEYVQRPEPAYKWEKKGEQQLAQVKAYELHLVSQVWQGITWEHRLQVFRPSRPQFPDICGLLITGGGGGEEETQLGMLAAQRTGMTFAILYHIPQQPLFGGKHEDELIAYTFAKFLETGDENWPLLFPMAKAAVKAMDALQEFGRQEWQQEITRFITTGASKRGWTTFFTACVDPRVTAIMPLVYDNLNLAAQMSHQLDMWGRYSPQIEDYTRLGLQQQMETEKGRQLGALVDPYTYRDKMTMPKLLVHGTNDPYWTVDATNLYWDDLPDPKLLLYAPNSGHGLDDRLRVMNTVLSFAALVAAEKPLPKLTWKYEDAGNKVKLTVTSDPPLQKALLWRAEAKQTDFREAKWQPQQMNQDGDAWVAEQAPPAQGFAAVFGEAVYQIEGRTFTLSTQMRILGGK